MIESDTACSRWSLYTIGGNVPYTRGAGICKASETSPGLQIVLCNDCLVALGMQQVTVLSFAHLGLCSGSCTRRVMSSRHGRQT